MSKIGNGFVLFSLLMALSLGVAFAGEKMAAEENVTTNVTANVTTNVTANVTTNVTANVTMNETMEKSTTEEMKK